MTNPTNKTRTTKPSFMRRQEGIRGATPVRPHFSPELASVDPKPSLDTQFLRAQRRRMTSPGRALSGQQAVARSFSCSPAVLCAIDPLSEGDRIIEWHRKRFARRMARIDHVRMTSVRQRVADRIEASQQEDEAA